MNTLKIFSKVIAWLGLFLVLIGTLLIFWVSWKHVNAPNTPLGFEMGGIAYVFAFAISVVGALLVLIGGLSGKPEHFFKQATLIVGLLYIVSLFYPNMIEIHELPQSLFWFLPGLVCICISVALYCMKHQRG